MASIKAKTVSQASCRLYGGVQLASQWDQNDLKIFIISNLGPEIDGKLREGCDLPDLVPDSQSII